MKKKFLLLLALFALLGMNKGFSHCEMESKETVNKFYISTRSGATIFEKIGAIEFEPSFYIGSVIGYKFTDSRVEFEYSYQRARQKARCFSIGKGHKQASSFFVNTFYDFDVSFPLKPYLGCGLGYFISSGHNRWSNNIWSQKWQSKELGLAWQAIGGIKYALCEEVEIGLEYRLFQQERKSVSQKVGMSLIRYF